MSIVHLFQNLIHPDWHVERKGSCWVIREENKTANPFLEVTGATALGFSLDQGSGKDPWPFLAGVKGMKSVSDAIVVTQIEDTAYIIAVEMKSINEGKAKKQIASTWALTKWIGEQLSRNGHWKTGWTFCGVVSSTLRRQERKGTSRRSLSIEMHKSRHGYLVGSMRNQRRLNLINLHNSVKAYA